jgi:hypothetical protein
MPIETMSLCNSGSSIDCNFDMIWSTEIIISYSPQEYLNHTMVWVLDTKNQI